MNGRRTLTRASAALVVCAALLLSACSGGGGSSSGDFRFSSATGVGRLIPAADRKPAQDFSGSLLSGGKTSLSASKGSVTVVNFWASWCGPCKVETPQFGVLYQSVKTQGIHFLGIDTKDDKGDAQSFVSQNKIAYPMIYDQQGRTALTLGNIPANLPFTVLVDKQGRVAAVYVQRFTTKDLQGSLDKLNAET